MYIAQLYNQTVVVVFVKSIRKVEKFGVVKDRQRSTNNLRDPLSFHESLKNCVIAWDRGWGLKKKKKK